MLDWDVEERIRRIKAFASRRRVPDLAVYSIKFRFLSNKTSRSGQVYLGGVEYEVIEEAFHQADLPCQVDGPELGSEFNRHESGPEIIGYLLDLGNVANLMGVAGGLYLLGLS